MMAAYLINNLRFLQPTTAHSCDNTSTCITIIWPSPRSFASLICFGKDHEFHSFLSDAMLLLALFKTDYSIRTGTVYVPIPALLRNGISGYIYIWVLFNGRSLLCSKHTSTFLHLAWWLISKHKLKYARQVPVLPLVHRNHLETH